MILLLSMAISPINIALNFFLFLSRDGRNIERRNKKQLFIFRSAIEMSKILVYRFLSFLKSAITFDTHSFLQRLGTAFFAQPILWSREILWELVFNSIIVQGKT